MSWTVWFFFGLIALTGLERLVELRYSKRHAAWAFERGGKEFGQAHYPFMVALHTAFLVAMPLEVWLLSRTVSPVFMGAMFLLALGCQALRWWCITTLGPRWNSRVIVVPGLPRVTTGPYRHAWLRHPNYLVVVTEGIVLPLVHGAWLSAAVFSVLNALLLRTRIRVEEAALQTLHPPPPPADRAPSR
jgi:methyltransferase